MNVHNHTPSTRLWIWQQNLNTSQVAQLSLLNGAIVNDWDILAIQEPHLFTNGNTDSSGSFHIVYPSTRYHTPTPISRSVLLISKSLDSNSWQQLPFPSPDVTIVQLQGPYGRCTIFNVYNAYDHHNTI
ncbi:hypothetical protein BDN67DRAFT_913074, partial [Paxillus ammoniavirescens]